MTMAQINKDYQDMKEPENNIITGGLNFGEAIQQLKEGQRVAREGWNGKGQWLGLLLPALLPTTAVQMTLPYIYICTVQGDLMPWLASQTDMLADDWGIVS